MSYQMAERVLFADLSHQGHNIKCFPYGVGCVASYAAGDLGNEIEVDIFKSPECLASAFLMSPPKMVVLSNYLWNLYLSYGFIRCVKEVHPETIVVMGGPNYPEDEMEQVEFLESHSLVDFYLVREGEIPFLELFKSLRECSFDVSSFKKSEAVSTGCHYVANGKLISGEPAPKFRNIDDIPSPYLSGLFDKFFDEEGLAPLMQFTRGCPFTCSFCGEGLPYYSQLGRSSIERFAEELEYIAKRVKGKPTLYFADANFGMYKEDLEVCRVIASVQEKYGWPEKINTSTGKNQQERILQATKIVKGAMRFGAALQTTDKAVLSNIKRSNISTEKLISAAKRVSELNQVSYSELILSLPGETVQTHLKTLQDVIDAGFTRAQMYPLVLLPGTDMETPKTRKQYGLESKFRILPRCFGRYRFGTHYYNSAEIVEMVVSQASMSFEEYLFCKQFQFSVEVFYNDSYLQEIQGLLRYLGLSVYEFIERCHKMFDEFPQSLRSLYDGLKDAVAEELWDIREDLERFVKQDGNLKRYAESEYRNSLATNRAVALMTCAESIHDIAHAAIKSYLDDYSLLGKYNQYISEAIQFSLLRKVRLLDASYTSVSKFHFDFEKLEACGFAVDPLDFIADEPIMIRFWHRKEVADEIERLYTAFEDPILGMRNVIYSSTATTAIEYFRSYKLLPILS